MCPFLPAKRARRRPSRAMRSAVARPEIFNTDQGAQFTGQAWTSRLQKAGVQISMDGKGRALDNVFVERLWRTVKYEKIYLKAYEGPAECRKGLEWYFPFTTARGLISRWEAERRSRPTELGREIRRREDRCR